MNIEEKISELGITLPELSKPLAAYVPAIKTDTWVFTAGQLPISNGELVFKGKIGKDISIEDGQNAARMCALNALSAIRGVIGDLNRITQIIKVVGYVNSAPGFTQQPLVINGASEFLKEIFGDKGAHARSAVGVSELPLDAAVEVELIVSFE